MAGKISKDIQGTTFKLEKLAQREFALGLIFVVRMMIATRGLLADYMWFFACVVAKRKTLFDDRPVEISVSLMSSAAWHRS